MPCRHGKKGCRQEIVNHDAEAVEAARNRDGDGNENDKAERRHAFPVYLFAAELLRSYENRDETNEFQRECDGGDYSMARWDRCIDDNAASNQRHARHPADEKPVHTILESRAQHGHGQCRGAYPRRKK